MANEISHDHTTGDTLYACRFQLDGNVFLTNGASDEVWGTSGDADFYDVTMTEDGSSGHFVGSFDASSNIAAGVYQVAIYLQAGANPADTDTPLARGEIYWDGSAEINIYTLDTSITDDIIGVDGDTLEILSDQMDDLEAYILSDIIGVDGDTLKDLSDQMEGLTPSLSRGTNVYGPGE